jgi:predicted MPP superfamily phosphohydrolase
MVIKLIKFIIMKILTFIFFLIQYLKNEKIKIERIQIKIKNLPKEMENFKIVHMTDFHYESINDTKNSFFQFYRLPNYLLEDLIEKSNKYNPDLILLTGDYVEFEWEPIIKLSKRLEKLKSKYGIFGSLGNYLFLKKIKGNHDNKTKNGNENITKYLGLSNIKILSNEVINIKDKKLEIVGIMDTSNPNFWEYKKLNNEMSVNNNIRIVISHNPDSVMKIIENKWKFDLMLCGHVHGKYYYKLLFKEDKYHFQKYFVISIIKIILFYYF